MNKHNTILKIATIILVCAIAAMLFCSVFFTVSFFQKKNMSFALCASDQSIASAGVAGIYGDNDASDLWYYNSGQLDIAGLKTVIDKWDKNKFDKKNPLVIAVIDTGIKSSHSVFGKVLLKDAAGNTLGYNSYNALSNSDENSAAVKNVADLDKNFHGTSVAGIVAITILELGLEDYIKIYPIKASCTKNDKEQFEITSVTKALQHIASGKIKNIVAATLSFGRHKTEFANIENSWDTNKALLNAISEASRKTNLIASAGNGLNGTAQNSSKNLFYPAASDGVISVMGHNRENKRVSSSNYGNAYDIIAPGEGILTADGGTNNGYKTESGTSMGTPLVAVGSAILNLKLIDDKNKGAITAVPDALKRSLYLRAHGDKYITESAGGSQTYAYKVLDLKAIANANYNNPDIGYISPKEVDLYDNGAVSDPKTGEYTVIIDNKKPLKLTATIKPFGDTDPAYERLIEWWEVSLDSSSEKLLGKGTTFIYLPTAGGRFGIEMRLNANKEFVKDIIVNVNYAQYFGNQVKVTLASDMQKPINDATSEIKVYTGEKAVLGLTGMQYVDPNKKFRWLVNGSIVMEGTYAQCKQYVFAPKTTGKYIISAEYQIGEENFAEVIFENNLVLNVQNFAMRPVNMFTIIASCVLAVGVISVAVVITVKKKKRSEV